MDTLKSYFKKILQIIQKVMPFSYMNSSKTYSYIHNTIQNYKDDITNLKKLSLAIEENPCIILITDKHGIIEYVNSAFTRITGYSKEDAIGKTPAILESGLQSSEFYRDMWDTILKGEMWQGEILNKTKAGKLQWQFVRIAPIKDALGCIVNYVGIQEDISDHKNNQIRLSIFQQAVDKSPVSIVVTDKTGNISYVNPHFTKITGYDYKEVIGNNPKIIKSGKQPLEYYQNLWQTISSGNVWQGELCNVKKNGEEFWEQVIITPIFNRGSLNKGVKYGENKSSIEHYVAVKLDITDARKAEQAIRDSEYRFKSIIASMEQGFWMVDKKWRTIEVNSATCEMVGVCEKKLIGRSIYDFFDEEHKHKIKTYIRNWNPSSRSSFEVVLLRPDGGRVHCLISHTPIFDQKHRRIGVFAVITDFTKRKEMEKQLIEAREKADEARQRADQARDKADEAREKAEKASRIKSDFLANMSHEIRTPMNSILGFLELALEEDLSVSQRSKLSIAHSSATALLSLLNDILDFSKIEQKRMTTEIRTFDLRELIKTRLDLLAIKAVQKGLKLNCEIAPDLSEKYLGDPLRIGQVLVNIVGNAIKFTAKGKVDVTVEQYKFDENMLLFSVKDTGIGISEQHKLYVFEPFTQADASTTRRFGGTGLGTAISKQLVEMMGGKIWFESKEGEGTIFYFTIKMVKTTNINEEKDDNKMSLTDKISGLNILIADDLEENILLTKLFLEKRLHRVIGVNNGIEAVEKFQKENFDIILMDVHMPEMDGIEATRKIRALEKETNKKMIPIIAVTASVMNEEREIYENAGMDASISKPINFKELDELISNFVKVEKNKDKNIKIPDFNNKNIKTSGFNSEFTDKFYEVCAGIDIQRAIDNWSNLSVFTDVLSKFYNENRDVYKKIDNFIAENNISEIRRITHALKGLSGNLSLLNIFSIFTEMDRAAVDKQIDILKSFLPELTKELDKIPLYIKTICNNLNTAVEKIDQEEELINAKIYMEKIAAKEKDKAKNIEENIKNECIGVDQADNSVKSLLSDFIAACDQYSPDEVYPFLEKLKLCVSELELRPLVDKIDQFDFDAAKDEAVILLNSL